MRLSISPSASINRSDTHAYDKIGNLTRKGNSYSSYNYVGAKPHALKSVATSAGTRSYTYDANGNMKVQSGGGTYKSVQWTTYNKPRYIYRNASNKTYLYYAANRARYKQDAYENGKRTITHYATGGLYEKKTIYTGGGISYEHHHYIRAGGRVIGLFKKFGSTIQKPQLNFLHKDYQGSVLALTNASGTVLEQMSYDPWGKRRSHSTWYNSSPTSYLMGVQTKRGYTGHEMLDSVGLIHMNGRVYDPDVGRFLSADPNIQFPESTQGFNRYTYVNNNPMSYNDPSGFFIKGLIAKAVGSWITGVTGQAWLGKLVEGFMSSGGDIKAYLMNNITSGVTGGIAGRLQTIGFNNGLAGIIAGGATAELRGGSFKDGAKGAAMGMAEGIAQGAVVDAGSRIGNKLAIISSSGTSRDSSVGVVSEKASSCAPQNPAWSFKTLVENKFGISSSIDEDGTFVIEGEVTISGYNAEEAASAIQSYWSGERVIGDVKIRSNITARAVAEGGELQIHKMTRSELKAKKKAYVAKRESLNCDNAANLNWKSIKYGGNTTYGGTLINIGDRGTFESTIAHEFGHTLGLTHAPRGSGSIMSYDANRSVKTTDMMNLFFSTYSYE